MIAMDTTVVATVLTVIRQALHASVGTLEWTVNAYTLTFGVLLLTGAALGDRFGRRRMFVAGLGVFTAASAACALSPTIGVLIAARVVQGAGAALVLPLAMTQLTTAYPPRRRGRALGLFTGLVGLATFSGPFVGGLVGQHFGWAGVFWLNVPVGVVVIWLSVGRLAETFGPRTRLDLGGVALATGGGLGLVWGLVRGNPAGWGSAEVVGALTAGAALVAGFVGWELRRPAPMLQVRLFLVPAFRAANAANFCLVGSTYGALFFLAQYLQTVQGYGPMAAGLRLMPWTGLVMICAPVAGALADRIGARLLLAGGLVLQATGLLWLAAVAAPGRPYPQLLVPLVVSGIGVATGLPAAQKAAVGAVGAEQIGQASGAFNALRQIGGTFGIALAVAVFAAAGGYGTPQRFATGFTAAMAATAACAVAGAVAAAWTGGRATPMTAQPPAIAPMTRNGSSPVSTRSGSGESGGSLDRSSSHA